MSVQRFEPFVVLSKILEVRDYAFSEILLGKEVLLRRTAEAAPRI
jgi:hypothetical protein